MLFTLLVWRSRRWKCDRQFIRRKRLIAKACFEGRITR